MQQGIIGSCGKGGRKQLSNWARGSVGLNDIDDDIASMVRGSRKSIQQKRDSRSGRPGAEKVKRLLFERRCYWFFWKRTHGR